MKRAKWSTTKKGVHCFRPPFSPSGFAALLPHTRPLEVRGWSLGLPLRFRSDSSKFSALVCSSPADPCLSAGSGHADFGWQVSADVGSSPTRHKGRGPWEGARVSRVGCTLSLDAREFSPNLAVLTDCLISFVVGLGHCLPPIFLDWYKENGGGITRLMCERGCCCGSWSMR